jgi:tripartite-type tricarboxylate transporter receptor subunit TctC
MRVPLILLKRCLAKAFVLLVVAAMLTGAPRPAAAEDWPQRPVTLVIPFASGSMIDFVGRSLANDLSAAIGQPVVVETKSGGGGVVASLFIAKAPPDGYTLLLTGVGPAALRPLIDKSVGYDPVADFTPIILIGETPNVLLANPNLGVKTVKDLVAYAKSKGGRISIGHSGPGTMGQLCTILFAAEAGLDLSSVSYRGTAPMMIDVLGGQIDAGFPAYNPATRQATILAVSTDKRVDFLPDVPTMKESGFDLVGGTWHAILEPAHMPPEIVAKLNGVMNAFQSKPETRRRFSEAGYRVFGGPPARVTERIVQERTKWSKIIEDAKIGDDK